MKAERLLVLIGVIVLAAAGVLKLSATGSTPSTTSTTVASAPVTTTTLLEVNAPAPFQTQALALCPSARRFAAAGRPAAIFHQLSRGAVFYRGRHAWAICNLNYLGGAWRPTGGYLGGLTAPPASLPNFLSQVSFDGFTLAEGQVPATVRTLTCTTQGGPGPHLLTGHVGSSLMVLWGAPAPVGRCVARDARGAVLGSQVLSFTS